MPPDPECALCLTPTSTCATTAQVGDDEDAPVHTFCLAYARDLAHGQPLEYGAVSEAIHADAPDAPGGALRSHTWAGSLSARYPGIGVVISRLLSPVKRD